MALHRCITTDYLHQTIISMQGAQYVDHQLLVDLKGLWVDGMALQSRRQPVIHEICHLIDRQPI